MFWATANPMQVLQGFATRGEERPTRLPGNLSVAFPDLTLADARSDHGSIVGQGDQRECDALLLLCIVYAQGLVQAMLAIAHDLKFARGWGD